MPLLQQERYLHEQVESLLKEKNDRINKLNSLITADAKLCKVLGKEPFSISPSSVPSKEQLQKFNQHVVEWEIQKVDHLLAPFKLNLFSKSTFELLATVPYWLPYIICNSE